MNTETQHIRIDEDGNKFYYKNKAMTIGHRLDGPAFEGADGSKEWHVDGKLHRLDGPAFEDNDGSKAWWVDDKLHRLDGPAFEGADGSKEWHVDGKLHRLDKPAVDYASGRKEWWVDDKRHRLDGPAIENADGSKAWWVDDKRLSEEAFDTFTKPLEPMETMNDTPTYAMLADMRDRALIAERERDEARVQRDRLAEAAQNLCMALIAKEPIDITELMNAVGDALQSSKQLSPDPR